MYKRDSLGLIENLEHSFNEDGTVNWKALIPKKYFYLNLNLSAERRRAAEEFYKCPLELVDLEQVEPREEDLILKLSGIKYLLGLRGYTQARSHVKFCSPDFVAVEYWISFLPNFETGFQPVTFQENACAHAGNTNEMARQYLVETATNRAFCRCVRNFLGINVVSNYELQNELNIAPSTAQEEPEYDGPYQVLFSKMKTKKVDFAKFKEFLVAEKVKDAETFNSITDIPKKTVFSCLSLIEKI